MAGEDPEYAAAVRRMSCVLAPDKDRCFGAVEAHHAGQRHGMGTKADDDTCVPLCRQHHADWHRAVGYFKDWRRDQRREWARWAIAKTQEAYAQSLLPNDSGIPF